MEPFQPVKTTQLLDEAISTARRWETPLGKAKKGKAEEAFEKLKNGQLQMDNPQALIQRLRAKDFEAQKLALLPDIKNSMGGKDGYAFYLLSVPVLLFPEKGAQYRLLESLFTFEAQEEQRPLGIHNIFPTPFWKPVLDLGGSLNLALDGGLEWGAEVDLAESKIAKLGGQLTARVQNKNQLTSFLKILLFEHSLGKMEIEAQYSAGTAMWRLDSKKAIRSQKHVRFVMLLKVPKEVEQIQLQAALQAEVDFGWLTAEVSHVFERLPQAIRQIIKREKGLPLQDFQNWTLHLP